MSLPRRLSLRTIGGSPRLIQQPPKFIQEQLLAADPAARMSLAQPIHMTLSGHSLMELQWDPNTTGQLRLTLQGDAESEVVIEHSPATGALRVTRQGAAVQAVHAAFPSTSTVALDALAPVRLLLSLDGPLLELFINDGEATAANLVLLGSGPVTARFAAELPGHFSVLLQDVRESETPARPSLPGRSPVRL